MELVDTHCHLQFDKFTNPSQVVKNAHNAGVTRMICVGTSLSDSQKAIDFAQAHEKIWASVGTHPHEAEQFNKKRNSVQEFEEQLRQPKVVAIGEIGLDYYKNHSPKTEQEKAFRLQIEAGLASNLPFIFHVRDAWADFWRIVDEYKNLHGVVHSFSSGTKQLNAALNRGLYVGLNGIMTFTKDDAQLEAARQVPLDRLLLETDAPFLAPEPFRNDICEPKHIANIAEFLAKLRGESVEQIASSTTDNAIKLFGIK